MRLHRLRLVAFGPFAEPAEVDFDRLGASGLFLFTGPTGAGKTSVLDAVCFALYGQVPGARQQARSLRSDHAAPHVAPEVVLEVTLRGRRLRVTRSPAWSRPKRRGTGSTTEPARALVQEHVDGGWATRSTRPDEAGQLLGDLLGLSMGQFCQVVLLPQGQFADFLRADADRRRVLLESLFDTRRFADVESWLVGRRQESARALVQADTGLRALLARVAEASGAEVPDDLAVEHAPTWVGQLRAGAVVSAEVAGARLGEAAAVAASAADACREAVELTERQARAVEARTGLDALLANGPAEAAVVAELEAARRVAPVLPVLDRLDGLRAELAAAVAQAEASRAPVEALLLAVGGAPDLPVPADATRARGPVGLPSLSGEPAEIGRRIAAAARRARAEVAELGGAVAQEAQARALEREADELARSAVELESRRTEAVAWLDAAPGCRARLVADRDATRELAGRGPVLDAGLETATSRLRAARRRDELATALHQEQERVRTLTDAHQQARDLAQAVRAARLDAVAADLAAGLVAGTGCPVCGSTTHPAPATASTSSATAGAEEQAAAAAEQAEAARRSGEARLERIGAELAAERRSAGGDEPVAALEAAAEAVRAEVGQARAAAKRLPAAEDALARLDAEHESWVRTRVGLDERSHSLGQQVSQARRRAAGLLAAVRLRRGDDPSVAARAARLQVAADDLDGVAALVADVERLRREMERAEAQADAALLQHGLADTEAAEARAASRTPEEVELLDARRRTYDAALAAARAAASDPALVAAARLPAPDLLELQTSFDAAERARDEATGDARRVLDRVGALERLGASVDEALAGRAPLAARHRVVDGLARLAEGKSSDNRLRMSLSAYVLAARLEAVAAAASSRLLRMTSGRYSLLHAAEAGSGRSRGGLALRVLDAWTGRERDPATLSGGESFAASLALALGLADVVTAEAGGAVLETLFVDEGFGSLDDDTLDEVMAVLDDLRDGGRTVGLVSHVADLRQRIPTQLRVDKGRHGSLIHS